MTITALEGGGTADSITTQNIANINRFGVSNTEFQEHTHTFSLSDLTVPTEDFSMGGTYTFDDVPDPVSDLQVSNKRYVDLRFQGFSNKASVRVATTANITLSGEQTIDGVSIVADEDVLVKNQSTASENGIYTCKAGSWERRNDADTGTKIKGALTLVREGSTHADQLWSCITDGTITIDSTSLSFDISSTLPDYAFQNPLLKSGGTISFQYNSSFFEISGSSLSIKADAITLTEIADAVWTSYAGNIGTSGGNKPANIYTGNIASATGNFTDDITLAQSKKIKQSSNYFLPYSSGNLASSSVGSSLHTINNNATNSGTYSFAVYAGSSSSLVWRVNDKGLQVSTSSDVVSTNFTKVWTLNGLTLYRSDGTDPNGTLSGIVGDVCFGCPGGTIKTCTSTGTTWA